MADDTHYRNMITSGNPCPVCIDAEDNAGALTLEEWATSQWGDTDSIIRYCNQTTYCHCVFIPEEVFDEIPELDYSIKLRGDDETDIDSVIDIHPGEEELRDLMDEYNARFGVLPRWIYDYSVDEMPEILRKLLRVH